MAPRFALSSAPASEPVTLAEAKAHARIEHSAEDAQISAWITVARVIVEKATNRALVAQTWTATLDRWPPAQALTETHEAADIGWPFTSGFRRIALYPVPVASISSLVVDGVTIEAANYALRGGEIWISGEVADSIAALGGGIVITYSVSSAGDAAALATFKQAIMMLVAHFYENREAVAAIGVYQAIMPVGVDALLMPYRRHFV
ncbi:MAG: hypothetical protein GC206_13425 [Alphaproteobacteria bacterium]|nr:hypothetical protein [Alphaproteobacteria bacterium]